MKCDWLTFNGIDYDTSCGHYVEPDPVELERIESGMDVECDFCGKPIEVRDGK